MKLWQVEPMQNQSRRGSGRNIKIWYSEWSSSRFSARRTKWRYQIFGLGPRFLVKRNPCNGGTEWKGMGCNDWRSQGVGIEEGLMRRISRNGGTECRGMGCNGWRITYLDHNS